MSDYELASLFGEYLAILEATFINYISVLFAFLIAAYVVSEKLKPLMIVVVLAIYTAFSLNQFLSMSALASDLRSLENLIADRVALGAIELNFHSGGQNALKSLFVDITAFFSLVGGYLGSIWFFFYQRSRTKYQSQI